MRVDTEGEGLCAGGKREREDTGYVLKHTSEDMEMLGKKVCMFGGACIGAGGARAHNADGESAAQAHNAAGGGVAGRNAAEAPDGMQVDKRHEDVKNSEAVSALLKLSAAEAPDGMKVDKRHEDVQNSEASMQPLSGFSSGAGMHEGRNLVCDATEEKQKAIRDAIARCYAMTRVCKFSQYKTTWAVVSNGWQRNARDWRHVVTIDGKQYFWKQGTKKAQWMSPFEKDNPDARFVYPREVKGLGYFKNLQEKGVHVEKRKQRARLSRELQIQMAPVTVAQPAGTRHEEHSRWMRDYCARKPGWYPPHTASDVGWTLVKDDGVPVFTSWYSLSKDADRATSVDSDAQMTMASEKAGAVPEMATASEKAGAVPEMTMASEKAGAVPEMTMASEKAGAVPEMAKKTTTAAPEMAKETTTAAPEIAKETSTAVATPAVVTVPDRVPDRGNLQAGAGAKAVKDHLVQDRWLWFTGAEKKPLYKYPWMDGEEKKCQYVWVNAQRSETTLGAPFFDMKAYTLSAGGFNYRSFLKHSNRKAEVIYAGPESARACYRLMAGDYFFAVVLDYTKFMARSLAELLFQELPWLGDHLAVDLEHFRGGVFALPYKFRKQDRVEEGYFRFRHTTGVKNCMAVKSGFAGHVLVQMMMHLAGNLATVKALGKQERESLRAFVLCASDASCNNVLRGEHGVLQQLDLILGVKTDENTKNKVFEATMAYWQEWCKARMQQFPVIEATMREVHELNPTKALMIVHSQIEGISGKEHDVLCGRIDKDIGRVVGSNLVGFSWGHVLNSQVFSRLPHKEEPKQAASEELV